MQLDQKASFSMQLYYSPGACSLAPHIVLEEIGKPYQRQLVSSMDGSTQSPEYLKINPKSRVPALRVGDAIITEVAAIMVYLATANPSAKLLATTANNLAYSIEWLSWLGSGVHALSIAQNWRTERFSDDQSTYHSIRTKGMNNLVDAYQLVEQRMQGCDIWAVNNTYSIVDPYLLVFYRWGNRLGVDMQEGFPSWTKHTIRMLDRPAVNAVLEVEGISIWQ